MAHHSKESLPDDLVRRMAELSPAETRELRQLALGATGKFPRGKLTDEDEGEIKIGIAYDQDTETVILDFGKPVTWIGFTRKQALDISRMLAHHAKSE